MNTTKYGIPVIGALAVSMTGCQDLLSSGPDGDWDAIEFNGKELAEPYAQGDGYASYLSLTMNLSNGELADATWSESYSAGYESNDFSTELLGDYIIDENGDYDIVLEAATADASPSKLELVCSLTGGELICPTVINSDSTVGAAVFQSLGAKQ